MNTKLLDELVENGNYLDKMNCVKLQYGLDKLVRDRSDEVRREVAKQGYGLDILINDTDTYVRSVARRVLTYLNERRGTINEPEY